METQTRSKLSVQKNQNRFLIVFAIVVLLIALAISLFLASSFRVVSVSGKGDLFVLEPHQIRLGVLTIDKGAMAIFGEKSLWIGPVIHSRINSIGGANMFTKSAKVVWKFLCVGTLFCSICFLFAMPCLAAPKGKVVIGIPEHSSMTGGDPHTAAGAGGINIANLIHEGLVRMDINNRYVPALAKSWEVSKMS